MGKIVIKTTRKSNVSKVKVRGFKRLDAAKMALYAFIGITGGLTQEDREHILQVADIIIQDAQDATDEINVEMGKTHPSQSQEQKDEDNSN